MKGFCRVEPCRRLEGVVLFEMSQQVWTALINNAIIANRTRQTSSRLRMSSDQRLFWRWKENSPPLSHLLDLLVWQQRQLNNHRFDQRICIFMGVFAKRKCSADRRGGISCCILPSLFKFVVAVVAEKDIFVVLYSLFLFCCFYVPFLSDENPKVMRCYTSKTQPWDINPPVITDRAAPWVTSSMNNPLSGGTSLPKDSTNTQ